MGERKMMILVVHVQKVYINSAKNRKMNEDDIRSSCNWDNVCICDYISEGVLIIKFHIE